MSSQDKNSALPHVACVVLWYPVFTQPFIFREIEGLKKNALPLTVYSLYGPSLGKCSAEMCEAAAQTCTLGVRALPSLCLAFVKTLLMHPLRTLRLFNEVLLRRWRNIESAGEVVWGFFAGLYLASLFEEAGIDLIYAPWPKGPATAAWVASRLSGLPFAMIARGDNLDPLEPDLVDKMRETLFIRANNQADQARIRALLPTWQADKLALIYNSLTLPPAPEKPRAAFRQPVRLLAVGRFSATKGFEYLLEACSLLKKQNFPFKLTLIGGGGLIAGGYFVPRLSRLRNTLGLQDCVDMPGTISHNKLPDILAAHDIFVAPCVVAPDGQRDGIPNVIIEAMAFALPVISTRVNAIPEVVRHGETGLLVEQRDAGAIAGAVRQLCAQPEEAALMAERGRKLVLELFDENTNIPALREVFATRHADFMALRQDSQSA